MKLKELLDKEGENLLFQMKKEMYKTFAGNIFVYTNIIPISAFI